MRCVQCSKDWDSLRDATVIAKCEEYARYTLASIFQDPLCTSKRVTHDFQSVGGVLVNSLATKLVNSLFPVGIPFFRNQITDALREAAERQGQAEAELSNILARIDKEAAEGLLGGSNLATLINVVKLLIVTGQVLMYRNPDNGVLSYWNLHSFVVKRSADGQWRVVVLKQKFTYKELPDEIRNDLADKQPAVRENRDREYTMFTKLERQSGGVNDRITVVNEIDGIRVGPEASYPAHMCPYILPVWNLPSGAHYATGYVEDHTGDFAKLSILSEQLGLYELEALSILNLVDESAGAVVDTYVDADVGDFVPGKTGAVVGYERGEYNKINAVNNSLQLVVTRLAQAFMYTGNTRDAERVTAEEIRTLAKEAEQLLGGTYSMLAAQMQEPLAYLCMADVSPSLLPALITRAIKPTILTGTAALTRNIAVQNLLAVTQEAATLVPALTQLDTRVDGQKVMDLLYSARGIDTSLIFKTPEQLQQEALAKEQAATSAMNAGQDALLASAPQIQESLQNV